MTVVRMFYRFTLSVIYILIVVGATLVLVPKYRQLVHLRTERERLAKENEQTEMLIAEVRARQQRFASDPQFVERIAHRNRRLRPNETVFVIEQPQEPIPD